VASHRIDGPELALVAEAKVAELLSAGDDARFEASGVVVRDGVWYVVFDNIPHVGRISGLSPASESSLIELDEHHAEGYEDIAHDPGTDRFYLLIEAARRDAGFMAKVREYDAAFRHLGTDWLPFPLETANKGMEGLSTVTRAGETYLLALCEGNRCRAGAAGRRPGGGRIQVFGRTRGGWDHAATIRLPPAAWFVDYSSVAVADDHRIAVTSQESSALWLGVLDPARWEIIGDGTVYRFPSAADGGTYGTVEGIAWLARDQVVVVSDKAKPTQAKRCRITDQSVHHFQIPASGV
jgi:hypothetical protein